VHSAFRFMQNDLVMCEQLEACRICFVMSCNSDSCVGKKRLVPNKGTLPTSS
jgi:hypothetical protein